MSARQIQLYDNRTGRFSSLNTTAVTWGELKQEIANSQRQDLDPIPPTMEGMDEKTNNVFRDDEAQLPKDDCTIWIVPGKAKSGN